MKKLISGIAIFLLAFSMIVCFPQSIRAEENLVISSWMIDAYLAETGDLLISEDITFKFNDEFNGVFREIVLDGTSGVSNIQVQELTGGASREYAHVENARNGDSDVFLTENEKNKIVVKIFSPSEDQEKTFRISYTVKNVAIRYNDTGELYYKFLGDENETPVKRFKVNIILPQADTNNQVKVFAHGPLNGRIQRKDNTTYSLYVEDVPSDTFIEGRVLFPKEFISLSDNTRSINNYSNILEEEAAYQNKLIEDAERKEKIRKSLEQASIWTSGFGLALFILFLIMLRRGKNITLNHGYTGIPEDCTPAVAACITGALIGTNIIFATMLDLSRKGHIKISKGEDNGNQESYGEGFVIHKVRKADNSLLNHEKHFISWMINEMGDGESVSNGEIECFSTDHSTKFISLFTQWKNKIKEDAVLKGYYDRSKTAYGVFFMVFSIALLTLGIFTAVYGSFFGAASIFLAIILFTYSIILFTWRSDYGYEQYRKWMDFRKHMKKHTKPLTERDLTNSPDISLIYALSLGVEKKPEGFDPDAAYHSNDAYVHNGWLFWYILFMNTQDNTFHKSIDRSFGSASGSSSGSGGSFSGGGGGGAGGGGAGGF